MSERMETGPVRFGNDWAGVFIRGDEAFGLAMALEQILRNTHGLDAIAAVQAAGLVHTLRSCDERGNPKVVEICWPQPAAPEAR